MAKRRKRRKVRGGNVFASYKDKHKNEPAYLIGSGPTIHSFLADQYPVGVYIGVNETFLLPIHLNYIITEKQTPGLDDLPEEVTVLHCETVKMNKPNSFTYREQLAEFGPFQGTNKETIKRFGANSTMYHVFFFALFMGCNPIHLVGCDCTSGNFYDKNAKYSRLVRGWSYIKEYVKQNNPDVKIININPVNLKDVFRSVYIESCEEIKGSKSIYHDGKTNKNTPTD